MSVVGYIKGDLSVKILAICQLSVNPIHTLSKAIETQFAMQSVE